MFRALRRFINAFLIGFLVTFVIYLFIRFDPSDVVLGVVIAAIGGAGAVAGYVYLDRRFGEDEVLYDKDGNPVRR